MNVDQFHAVCTRPTGICFVAHNAFAALAGGPGHVGGVERQTALMSKWLARRGHKVTVLTWQPEKAATQKIDGVNIGWICRREKGVPGVRFLHPRWTGLNSALHNAAAEVYYHNCGEYVTGQVALWCKLNRRRFVYSVASDTDADSRLPLMSLRERLFYKFGLKRADGVIAQTYRQQSALRDGFQVTSVVLPMPCPGPSQNEFRPPVPPGETKRVLWLGRIVAEKRVDRLVAIAERCPDFQFVVVGPVFESPSVQAALRRARELKNVSVRGPADRSEVERLMRESHCLCSTSDYEGFPNTYLEAWAHGLPVAVLVDPDSIVRDAGLGVAATTLEGLVEELRGLLTSQDTWTAASTRAREHYLRYHTVDGAMERFEQVLALRADAREAIPTARGEE